MEHSLYDQILLICKTGHLGAQSLAGEIALWLDKKSYATQICESANLTQASITGQKPLAIVLGGDGTMLSVGRCLVDLNVPILGINFGKIGFLTNVRPNAWEEGVAQCLAGQIPMQPRLILKWQHHRQNQEVFQGTAINDVVISHGAMARLINVNITINNEPMGVLRCDGIILATPVGSSGYTASAGGPILFAKTSAFVFTPICPFLRSVSPMVFPSKTTLRMSIEPGTTDCYLTIDGQETYLINANDYIDISAKPNAVIFLGKEEIFLERIRTRGLVLEQTYNEPGRIVQE